MSFGISHPLPRIIYRTEVASVLSGHIRNFSFNRHYHDCYSVGILIGGVEKMFYRGANHIGKEGDIVCISPGEIHDGFTVTDGGSSYSIMYLDIDFVHGLIGIEGRRKSPYLFEKPFVSEPSLVHPILAGMKHLQRWRTAGLNDPGTVEFTVALSDLFSRHASGFRKDKRCRADIVKAKSIIDASFHENLDTNMLASSVGVKPLNLIKGFKKAFGIPPHQYQLMLRVENVKAGILEHHSLVNLALENGFTDQSHMTKVFKKFVGTSPTRFRALIGG